MCQLQKWKMMNEKMVRKKKMMMKSDSLSQIFSMRSWAGERKKRRREKRLRKVDILLFLLPWQFSTTHFSKKKGELTVDILSTLWLSSSFFLSWLPLNQLVGGG